MSEKPTVVCLCGSTRFYEAFQEENFRETMAGNIVLTVGFYPHAEQSWGDKAHGETVGVTPEEKARLDELHKRKIDLADEILVLNVGCYIGDSTRSEIRYALDHHKRIRTLEPDERLAVRPCEDCAGSGIYQTRGFSGVSTSSVCASCHGHGWVHEWVEPVGEAT